ncbi:class I SAM-dependent methyltransferase [Planomicrobium sp. CPCC 101079]|uniref:class I SAM-dependent methyltransferase n=1 Tax=Planomicrobium sp. CPCC 101079 TaxID=2599618 RepID=UPI0011B5CF20|nr:class I SAM-dependent methyltransferase [Planomicrobium sp. CPCC 101079]TWT13332.1 class I SAM-dependent methyltransferase [Planomicrobium sp. CPCC 101079]
MLGYYSSLSSEVYDRDKPVGSSFGDIEYYTERLAACTGRILEPAVGTGRLLVPLLEKGFQVDGFDVSSDMLAICRENCQKRGLAPQLFEAEMESFSLDEEYGAIVIPTGTFLLLHEREKSFQALQNFRRHLADGGKLIVDVFLPGELELGRPSIRKWDLENGDVITLESQIVEVDPVKQYRISQARYEKWRNGKLIQTELERYPLRWYGVEEFRMILEHIGFRDIIISADYKFGEYPTRAGQTITFEAAASKKG